VPDGEEIEAGANFTKVWRARNSGSCPWPSGTVLALAGGHALGGQLDTGVPATLPGEVAEIALPMIAPNTPGAYQSYWRLRLPSGETIGSLLPVRITVPTPAVPTSTPVAVGVTQTPSPATPGTGLAIEEFAVSPPIADPGEDVLVSWRTTGAITVTIYHLLSSGQLGMPFWEVAPQGNMTITIGARERNWTGYVLFANDQTSTVQATISVQLRCPDTWFISSPPDICPADRPLLSLAAEQSFEHGAMIWVEAQRLIYVLFDDGASPAWKGYLDSWREGDGVDDPGLHPPSGLEQPIRGFGLVWRVEPGVRERLGWAVGPETAYSTKIQATSRYKYNDLYILAEDGRVYLLLTEGSGWSKIAP